MDRPIDTGLRNRRLGKRAATTLTGAAFFASLLIWLPGWVRPSLEREQIRTARVEWGAVEAHISASGTVVPEFEQVIASPIPSRIIGILQRPGAVLRSGDPIVELDRSESALDVERLADELNDRAVDELADLIELAADLS